MILVMTTFDDLLDVARQNHSLVARHHVDIDVAGRQLWWRATRSPLWEKITDRVVRLVGAAPTAEQHVAAAVLDAGQGAALYGVNAAAHWGIAGFVHSPRHPIHVLRPARARRVESDLAIIHTTARSLNCCTTTLRDIAVTTPPQTILDLARTLSVPRLEAAIDRALRKRIVSCAQLHDALRTISRSGRSGVQNLREALEIRPPGYIPTESNLESRVDWLMRGAGFGRFRRQVTVGGEEPVGRVDFLHAELPLILEVNSEEYHSALVDQLADAIRYEALQEAGFTVVPVWDSDIWYSPDTVIAEVSAARLSLRLAA